MIMKVKGSILLVLDHCLETEVLVPSEDANYCDLDATDQGQGFNVLALLVEDKVLLLTG